MTGPQPRPKGDSAEILGTKSFLLANFRLVRPRTRTLELESLGLKKKGFGRAIVVSSHILIESTFFSYAFV